MLQTHEPSIDSLRSALVDVLLLAFDDSNPSGIFNATTITVMHEAMYNEYKRQGLDGYIGSLVFNNVYKNVWYKTMLKK
jgi:hypothetical protein